MGKEHSHDTITVGNNSFIEYSCIVFKEVHNPWKNSRDNLKANPSLKKVIMVEVSI